MESPALTDAPVPDGVSERFQDAILNSVDRQVARFKEVIDETRNELLFAQRAREDLGVELARVNAQLRQRDAAATRSESNLKDLEAQLKLARAELENVRSDNAHLQAMAQTAGADTDHLRRQYNSALEEVMQMKKFHAVYQHDSTMHRQLESAWHREREIMQASVTQLQGKINEQERVLAKANERALALETQNAAQVDETKRAEIVLEKVVSDLHQSMQGQQHWNAAWQKAVQAMSQRDRVLVQVSAEHSKAVDKLTLLSQVEQRLTQENEQLQRRLTEAEEKLRFKSKELELAASQAAAAQISVTALQDRYEASDRVADRTADQLKSAEHRITVLQEQVERTHERFCQAQAKVTELEQKALSEAQVRARDAQDAKRAVIEVENEAIKAERELAARFAERENEARAASLRVTELELRLKTTETELMLTATALKASDQELVKIQKASGLMVAEMERATYAARRAEAQLYAAKQSQRTPAATTVAELRETQERLTEAQKQNSKLQAHAVESATELVKLREQVNALRRSQEEASVRLDVQSGVTEREQERVEAATKKYHDAVREMESMRLAHQKTQARVVDLQQLVTRLEAQNTDSTYQTLAHQEGHRAEREALRAEIHQLRSERVERRRGVDAESRQRSIMERSLQVAVEKHDNLKQHFNKLSLQIVEVNALNHQLSQHNAQLEAQCGRLQSQIETLMQRDIARATQGLVPTPPSGSATPRGTLPALPSARGSKPVFAFGMSSQLQAAKEQEDTERERAANAAIRDANRLRSLAAERLAELIAARQQFDAVSAEFEQLKEANEECKNRIKTLEQQRKHLARELLRVQQRSNRAEAASTILEQALRRVAPDTAATVEFVSSPDAEPSSVLKEFVHGSK